ncbi:MAG: N-acetylmuramoyl-L-alanine amidase, partial [Thermoleophilaceae bacterium]
MKRLTLTCALACAAVLAAVVAPALSARSYRPDPVQFSMPASGERALLGNASARGEGVVSKPLRAAKRFNVVGLIWRSGPAEPGIALRTRREGGDWSRWRTVYRHAEDGPDPRTGEPPVRGTASPLWAGEADWVQYRSTTRLPGLRLHFVNVRGTATASERAISALRRGANAGVLAVAGSLAPEAAGAQAGKPAMVSRKDWGASKCQPRDTPSYGQVKAAFVHHTVNANDYSRAEAPDVVLAICLFHRNTNGWDDIGYNFLVDRFGTIYEGRAGGADSEVIGAQAVGYNAQSTGIANLGTHTTVRQTPAAIRAVARIISWKLPLHGAPTSGPVTLVSTGGASNRYPAGRS